MIHPKMPPRLIPLLAGPTCPMRATQDPEVRRYQALHRWWRRFGSYVLEAVRARPRDLEALELLDLMREEV